MKYLSVPPSTGRCFQSAGLIVVAITLIGAASSALAGDDGDAAAAATPVLDPVRLQGSVELIPGCLGVHPRLLLDQAGFDRLSARFKEHPEMIRPLLAPLDAAYLRKAGSFNEHDSSAWYNSTNLPWIAWSYRITGDQRYLDLLDPWIEQVAKMSPMDPQVLSNTDLMDGHIMASLALLYDALRGQVPEQRTEILRDAMVRNGRVMYAHFVAQKSFTYEQNHFYIAAAGLGMASLALLDELPEAKAWADLSRNMLDISHRLIGSDGYYFEGGGYWNFSIAFQTLYAETLRRVTGENWLVAPPFSLMPLFPAYMNLPDGKQMFDFGDVDPAKGKADWHTGAPQMIFVSPVMPMAAGGGSPLVEPVVASLQPFESINHSFKPLFRLASDDARARATPVPIPVKVLPPYHYFPDHEVITWRENWDDPMATAFAFKCGPPEGHTTVPLMAKYADWRPEPSHPHPDAGSFILFSHGVYLANTTRYTDKKLSANENCILIDGQGQYKDGTAWATFRAGPYSKYDKIRMKDVWLGSTVLAATAVTEDAYDDALQCQAVYRHLVFVEGRWLVVRDYLRAAVPHTWQWLYHADQEPRAAGENRWIMVNGDRRVVIQGLRAIEQKLPPAAGQVAPTMVVPHPAPADGSLQQRGYHLEETSPVAKEFRFLNAITVGAAADPAEQVAARVGVNGEVEFRDGADACSVWLNESAVLKGQWAYLRTRENNLLSAGLDGAALTLKSGFTLSVNPPGQVIVKKLATGWSVEAQLAKDSRVTLQVPGEALRTTLVPAGKTEKKF